MSDYLSNLLSKSLNQTEVIQPRLASLFEPQGGMEGSVFSHASSPEMEDEQAFSEKTFDDSSSGQAVDRPQVGHHQKPSSLLESRRHPADTMNPSDASPKLPKNSSIMPSLPRVEHPHLQEAPQKDAQDRPMPPEAATNQVVLPRSITRENPKPALKPAIQPKELSAGQTPHPSMLTRKSVQPQVMQFLEPKALVDAGTTKAPKPAPSIQVTIGRVEVRAMPAPAQPLQKKHSAAPVMSLDEYLRRRTKGSKE